MPVPPKDLDYYLSLPWNFTFEWIETDGGFYFASVDGLQCYSEGASKEEALKNIREALECHLESYIAKGKEPPEPYSA